MFKHYLTFCFQLKNMINALFASKEGGTRKFQTGTGTAIGWKVIVDMYTRECCRRDSGHARMVPKLRETHIIRDSWTKLNVTPAKIMQASLQSIWYVFLHQLGFFWRKSWYYLNCTNTLTVTLNQLVSAALLNTLRLVIASSI